MSPNKTQRKRSFKPVGGNDKTSIPLYYTLRMYKWKKPNMKIEKRSMITIDYQHRLVNWNEVRGVTGILKVLQDTNPVSFCVNEGASVMMLLDLVTELIRDNQNLNTLRTANNLKETISMIEYIRRDE